MKLKVHKGEEKGQVSMDFLLAISILLFGIAILISQIPMLFAPLQTVATDIQPVAYRTSMILVEDGGIYGEDENITSRWEDPEGNRWNYTQTRDKLSNYHGNVKRIGLAMPAPPWSSSEDIVPNNLSRSKIDALQDWWGDGESSKQGNSSLITRKLGLKVTYNNKSLYYSYNISLKGFDGSLIRNSTSGKALLQIGDPIPESGITIEKIERIVAIDDPTNLANCTKIGGVGAGKLVVCIWR
ncbi:MAG: DUF7287 family protein [Candidatus Methanospirareceae archaeon]